VVNISNSGMAPNVTMIAAIARLTEVRIPAAARKAVSQ
jgi:hypothetical protein